MNRGHGDPEPGALLHHQVDTGLNVTDITFLFVTISLSARRKETLNSSIMNIYLYKLVSMSKREVQQVTTSSQRRSNKPQQTAHLLRTISSGGLIPVWCLTHVSVCSLTPPQRNPVNVEEHIQDQNY